MVLNVDAPLSDLIFNNKKNTQRKSFGGGTSKHHNSKEFNRRKSSGAAIPRRQSTGGVPPTFNRSSFDNKRSVLVKISNLVYSVVSDDLKELFREFDMKNIVVNFDENGRSLGTADISISKQNAERLVKKFANVSVDGRQLKFSIVDTFSSRVDFRGRKSLEMSRKNGRISQKRTFKQSRSPKTSKREKKTTMTTEQLDAELDAYMSQK